MAEDVGGVLAVEELNVACYGGLIRLLVVEKLNVVSLFVV